MELKFKVSDVYISETFQCSQGWDVRLVNFVTVERIHGFKIDGDEKLEKSARQFAIPVGDFPRWMALNDLLSLQEVESEDMSSKEGWTKAYAKVIRLLRGATIKIDREVVTSVEYSDQPILDSEGNEVLDPVTGKIKYQPLLEEDRKTPRTKVIGYGETKPLAITLSPIAEKLAMKWLGL